jgi:hypothetical protein
MMSDVNGKVKHEVYNVYSPPQLFDDDMNVSHAVLNIEIYISYRSVTFYE